MCLASRELFPVGIVFLRMKVNGSADKATEFISDLQTSQMKTCSFYNLNSTFFLFNLENCFVWNCFEGAGVFLAKLRLRFAVSMT